MEKMRPLKALLPVSEATQLLWEETKTVERVVTVPLIEAAGRVLAEDIIADSDVPPFPRAAMDGYAVIAEDTFGASSQEPRILKMLEALHAGEVTTTRIERGQCIQIGTGAPMPEGANAVVIVEETEREGDEVKIYKPVYPGGNVSGRGSDIALGQKILSQGQHLNPSRVGVLAALGRAEVRVYDRPKVAVIPSGNEIQQPGETLRPGAIYDVNSYTLAALIRQNSCEPVIFPTAEDDPEAVKSTLIKALEECDMVVLSGGSSAGERDYMIDAVRELGEILFHGIAVKPGKPTLGAVVRGKVVIGMPGYPTSCLTNAYYMLTPLLRKMARLSEAQPRRVKGLMTRRVPSVEGKYHFLTVRVKEGQIEPAFKESGAITSMALADGYVGIPEEVELIEKGEEWEVILF